MIELVDTAPEVNVQPEEYQRLLGYPPGHELSERASELSAWAREWYRQNGRPWVYARAAGHLEIDAAAILIEGAAFHSAKLERMLRKARAHGAILVALGAGAELEQEAQRLWEDGKPDEYFFLEIFGSAVVEHLTQMTGARLCDWADPLGMAVLPHYSPGYPEWDLGEQAALLELIAKPGKAPLPGNLRTLDSGALSPKKSQLAVFGFTRHTELVQRLTELIPCVNCSLLGCHYRRSAPPKPALEYTIKTKALTRWADERLSLRRCPDGATEAVFRYEGTTCTNMGRALAFDYRVELGPREEGFPIRAQGCAPAPGDTGHTHMCRYIQHPGELSAAIEREKPLAGQPLSAVLSWARPSCAPGCYCEPASRDHKWGIVLETIQYALEQQIKTV